MRFAEETDYVKAARRLGFVCRTGFAEKLAEQATEAAKLTPEQWETHRQGDLWLSADEALAAGIATEVAEFAPPAGYRIFNV
jgi:ATP-dependent protease ClpP protease subunit